MIKIYLLSLVTISFIGCNNKRNIKLNKISESDSIKIKSGLSHYVFRKGKIYDIIVQNNKNSIFFNKNTDEIGGIIFENVAGQIVENSFVNNQLEYITSFYKNKKGLSSSMEVYWYSQHELDLKNSVFITVNKVKENNQNIDFEVKYNSGYTSKSGKIFFGKKIFSLADSSQLLTYEMKKKVQLISIPRDKIKGKLLEFSVLIERGVEKEIEFFTTHLTSNQDSYFNLYIKEFNL